MRKQPKKSDEFPTLKAFARALNSPPSTLAGWLRRTDWRWTRLPPWPAGILRDVLEWADGRMQRGPVAAAVERKDDARQAEIVNLRILASSIQSAETVAKIAAKHGLPADAVDDFTAEIEEKIGEIFHNTFCPKRE